MGLVPCTECNCGAPADRAPMGRASAVAAESSKREYLARASSNSSSKRRRWLSEASNCDSFRMSSLRKASISSMHPCNLSCTLLKRLSFSDISAGLNDASSSTLRSAAMRRRSSLRCAAVATSKRASRSRDLCSASATNASKRCWSMRRWSSCAAAALWARSLSRWSSVRTAASSSLILVRSSASSAFCRSNCSILCCNCRKARCGERPCGVATALMSRNGLSTCASNAQSGRSAAHDEPSALQMPSPTAPSPPAFWDSRPPPVAGCTCSAALPCEVRDRSVICAKSI
mmetsp:Transcript_75971/g.220634  ORF Transcript_75971/g.220634 Transcript_75971/m.220634 type:complete len:288 (-) Transcript_75971:332-1195(-)